jgi:hypothetical protein
LRLSSKKKRSSKKSLNLPLLPREETTTYCNSNRKLLALKYLPFLDNKKYNKNITQKRIQDDIHSNPFYHPWPYKQPQPVR